MNKKIISLLTVGVITLSSAGAFAFDINETYDDVKYTNNCDTALSGVTLNDGAPDGSKYYTLEAGSEELKSISGLDTDTSEDYLWEADVRFDEDKSGFTIKDKANKKVDTCVRRNGSKLSIQTGGSAYSDYVDIEPEKWYHIQLMGQYGTSKPLSMEVFEWENGELKSLGTFENVNKRNNVNASHFTVEPGTSFDNLKITKLGADELVISTVPANLTEVNAGSSVNMNLTAQRNGNANTAPEIEWKVYEDDNEVTDGSVIVSDGGVITAARDCPDKNIVVKAISTEKGNAEGEYPLAVKAIDFDSKKYDALYLSAENNYVRASQPLAITVSATKNDEAVVLDETDVKWTFYDENDIQPINNKYISVVNNELCVDEKVIPQNIVLHAHNDDGTVTATLPVRIKRDDITEEDDTTERDVLLISNACETTYTNAILSENSWDGSHYYQFDLAADLNSVSSTNDDIMISADVKFLADGAGVKLCNSGNNKEGGQIALQNGQIGNIGSGNKFTVISDGDTESWYHIDVVTRCGGDNSYGRVYIYKYDENGNLVNPNDGAPQKAAEANLDLRTMSTNSFHHLQVQENTALDNLYIVKIIPDEIQLTLSVDEVFAGGNVKGSAKAFHKGFEIPAYPQSKIRWAVYDKDNKYPIEGNAFTVAADGTVTIDATAAEQTVYIRAISTESDAYDSKAITVKGSDIFTVTGFGINETGDELSELRVQKNFFYNGNVVFVVAAYDENGVLTGIVSKSIKNNKLAIGENIIAMDFKLPDNFSEFKAMIWTSF